jgi:hypothetical protein
MSDTVNDLKKKLALAEQNEKLEREKKEMDNLIKNYVGKCFGTRTFTQKSKASWNKAIYIEKIERYAEHKHATAAGTIVCTYHWINLNNMVDWHSKNNPDVKSSTYSRGVYTKNLNQGDYNMSYNMSNIVDRMKEIPKETFDVLYGCGDEIEGFIEKAFSGKVNIEVAKTIGDSGKQNSLIESYKQMGIEYIDLEKYPELLYVLRYATLPAYFEDRFLIKDYAKKSLECQIAKHKKDLASPFCTRFETLNKEIAIIEKHIILLKL